MRADVDAGAAHAGGRATPLTLIAVLLTVGALWWAQVILIPLVLAGLCSYALAPPHRRLVSWGVPASLSAALILLSVTTAAATGGFALRHQATDVVDATPVVAGKLRTALSDWLGAGGHVGQVQQAASEFRAAAGSAPPSRGVTRVQVEDPPIRVTDLLWRGSLGAVDFAIQATIVLFLIYYALASGELYKRKIVKLAGPSLARKRVTVEVISQIAQHVERFLWARVIISVLVGLATASAFWALGVGQPAMWGVGAGVLNAIPYVGPSAVAIAAAIAGLLQFGTASMAVILAGTAVLIAGLEGFVLTPWLMGRAGQMNAGAVFVGLSFWGWIWGVWGLLLAVPIMMVVKVVCDHVDEWRPVSELLSE